MHWFKNNIQFVFSIFLLHVRRGCVRRRRTRSRRIWSRYCASLRSPSRRLCQIIHNSNLQGFGLLHTTEDAPCPQTPESSLECTTGNDAGTAVTIGGKKRHSHGHLATGRKMSKALKPLHDHCSGRHPWPALSKPSG